MERLQLGPSTETSGTTVNTTTAFGVQQQQLEFGSDPAAILVTDETALVNPSYYDQLTGDLHQQQVGDDLLLANGGIASDFAWMKDKKVARKNNHPRNYLPSIRPS